MVNLFEHFSRWRIYLRVRSLKRVFVLLLALAWVPMMAHCNLEAIPGFQFLTCDTSEASPDSHCGEGCCSFESSSYHVESSKLTPPIVFVTLLCDFLFFEPKDLGLDPERRPFAIPPELSKTWQFVFRTALPVRAPSIAS